jgi:hypothetical protein
LFRDATYQAFGYSGRIDVHTGGAVLFGLMPPKISPHLLAMFLSVISGCTRPTTTGQGRTAEAYVSDSGSVGFDIRPLKGQNGSRRLEATYESRRRLAKFAIEFGPTHNVESKDSKDFPMRTGQGRFLAEPGSDATVLLADLQKALEAKTIPAKTQRVPELPFTYGKQDQPQKILANVSQEMLAEMIGTTRPRVNFLLSKFKKLGFIHYNGGLHVDSSLLNVVLHE